MVIRVRDFNSFIRKCVLEKIDSIEEVIIPSKSVFNNSGNLFFTHLQPQKEYFDLGEYRTVDPIKILFYLPREKVLPVKYELKKRLIIGAKACDINALLFLDRALLKSGFIDPAYLHWRENTIIISSDCTSLLPNCLCTLLDEKPFPEKGFDLNLSVINDFYFIESASSGGENLLNLMKRYIPVENDSQEILDEVKNQRLKMVERSNEQLQQYFKPPADGNSKKKSDLWAEGSKSCVGCGSCTNICPTCYCLILNDESQNDQFIKVRSYDSCQLNGYARVAGGSSPRPKIQQRFHNRVMCKFSYTKSNFNVIGCTGCGRCLDACGPSAVFMDLGKSVKSIESVKIANSSSI